MAANRVNMTLGDMQLVQVDMLAELNGMNRSEYVSSLINREFGLEVLANNLDYNEMHRKLDEFCAKKYEAKRNERSEQ